MAPKIITIDFESFYSSEFGFSKLTTEEYVRHDDFEVIGVSVAYEDNEPIWVTGTHAEIRQHLVTYDWANSLLLAHNTMFDGAILNWVFGLKPKGYLDSLSMSRALYGLEVGNSLKALSERLSLGEKGTEVNDAKGKRRLDFTPEELAAYGGYCKNDVVLCRTAFHRMVIDGFPLPELKVIDITLRMFIEPELRLSPELLAEHLETVKAKKAKLLEAIGDDGDKDGIMSNNKFAELLERLGIVPPTKVSAKTGKIAWAFAKTDEDFKELLEHPDVRVQALVAARLGVKTTLEETRTQRFMDVAKRGLLPVPLKYYGAKPGRWSGQDKINMQNLQSRGKDAGKLKKAILAPEGYVIIDCDSAQIEARTLAWFAGQEDLVNAFANNKDVYKIMASSIFNKNEEEITEEERFLGKTVILGCFAADTKVLTAVGWKRIVEINDTDMLWDGESWVTHQGLVPQGEKEVITHYGISATPDHEILTEHGWEEWHSVCSKPHLFQSAINKGNLPSLTGSSILNQQVDRQGGTLLFGVLADGRGVLTDITSKLNALHDATRVLGGQVTQHVRNSGAMKRLCQMRGIVVDYLTGLLVAFQDAIQKLLEPTRVTGVGELQFTNYGEKIGQHSYVTSCLLAGGMTQQGNLTALTTTEGMNPTTYGFQLGKKIPTIEEPYNKCRSESKNLKQKTQTYDIAYAGANNRFTVLTDKGPMIVHNCGYGTGWAKLQATLKVAGVSLDESECRRIIDVYRQTYDKIPALWKQTQICLENILSGQASPLGAVDGAVEFDPRKKGFKYPSGLWITYDDLKWVEENSKKNLMYKSRTGMVKIHGPKCVENLIQGLARCVIAEQMVKISKRYKCVLTVHDSVCIVAPIGEAKEAQEFLESCMRWNPPWSVGLPLNCKSGMGASYGDCQ